MIWIFNVLLFLAFNFNFTLYTQMVANGDPCWVEVSARTLPEPGLGMASQIQPVCFYDASNTNSGYLNGLDPFPLAKRK
jgi:hypothetical protein